MTQIRLSRAGEGRRLAFFFLFLKFLYSFLKKIFWNFFWYIWCENFSEQKFSKGVQIFQNFIFLPSSISRGANLMSVALIQIFIFVIGYWVSVLFMSNFLKNKISKRSTNFSWIEIFEHSHRYGHQKWFSKFISFCYRISNS